MLIIIVLTNALFSLDDLIRTGAEFFPFLFSCQQIMSIGVCAVLCVGTCVGALMCAPSRRARLILNSNRIELPVVEFFIFLNRYLGLLSNNQL